MAESMLSVGLDVGTTTTQMVVSRLQVQNRASAFAVPDLQICDREVIYRSPVHLTPLLGAELIDGHGIRELVKQDYANAGIRPEDVNSGAVIITGETSRKENAASVVAALAEYAGKFVVATAGPDLESVLAAKGAGADILSTKTGKPVLHMDIGGGTSNLALCVEGEIVKTGCLNVGGRLVKMDPQGRVLYLSPALKPLVAYGKGDLLTPAMLEETAQLLAQTLEMAARLREPDQRLTQLCTAESGLWEPVGNVHLSFSGGVADCIGQEYPMLAFGDLGPALGKAIKNSRLCGGEYSLGQQTIRATVIGAGSYSTQLSGSTVYLQNAPLPLHNLSVVRLQPREQDLPEELLQRRIRELLETTDPWGVLSVPGWNSPDYKKITRFADAVVGAVGDKPCRIALETDMAKALGHALALRLPAQAQCICLDGIHAREGSYLDIGAPVGPAVAVTVKTLIFGHC